MVRSLIQQFSHQSGGTPIALAELYGPGEWHPQPSIGALYAVLESILDSFSQAYVIVDSLDECTDRSKLLKWIERLSSRRTGRVNLLFTSRPELDIRILLESILAAQLGFDDHNNSDIEEYLDDILQTDESLASWDDITKADIKDALMEGAHGM